MTLRKPAPASVPPAHASPSGSRRAKARIFARLGGGGRRGTTVTVPFAAAASLFGRLLDADGAGLAGRRLRVVARPSRGSLHARTVDHLRTGSHGGFHLGLPAGTSRRIAVVFPGDHDFEPARRAPLSLRVRGAVVLHASPETLRRGEAVRLWGRVLARGAPVPRRGKLVAVQYLEEATGRWRPVIVTRTDHGGRFRVHYRFRYVTGRTVIRLRALALSEERWPYAPGASPSTTVRVSG
jgi:hypothetical protein